MIELAPPAIFALLIWWSSTGAIFILNSLERWTHRFGVTLMSAIALLALWGIWSLRDVTTPAAAYLAFTYAIAVWGWHETTFMMGMITGPVRTPCPKDATGIRRFWLATGAVIYHELALVGTLALIAVLVANAENSVALWTFTVLWIMRLSAKFNLYLGVRNFTDDFVPDRMRYLSSYFGGRTRNALMPASLLGAGAALVWLASVAFASRFSAFHATATMLVATLLALAWLEHVFLIIPVRESVLWGANRSRNGDETSRRAPAKPEQPTAISQPSARSSLPVPRRAV